MFFWEFDEVSVVINFGVFNLCVLVLVRWVVVWIECLMVFNDNGV